MKVRRRKYKISEKKEGYWPSFVDAMTATTLVFFFLMIISIGMTSIFSDDIAKNREDLYNMIDKSLEEMKVSEDIIKFNRDAGAIEIYSETTFEKNKDNVKKEGKMLADKLEKIFYNLFSSEDNGDAIVENIDYIEVVGHTDYAGSTTIGRTLSAKRAASFLNEMVPEKSKLEKEFGNKFKASGMSEFESYGEGNGNKDFNEVISWGDKGYNENAAANKAARKIEIRIVFNNDELEKILGDRMKESK